MGETSEFEEFRGRVLSGEKRNKMVKIDKEFIIKYAKKFNEKSEYAFDDYLISNSFKKNLGSPNHYERIVLLNFLFKTNLNYKQKEKSLYQISEEIFKNIPDINKKLEKLSSNDLMKLKFDINDCGIISDIVNAVMGCCVNKALSFTGKYLHFLKPSLFVPWDSRVPKAINKIEGKKLINKDSKSGDEYIKLLKYYRNIINRLSNQEITEIIRIDFETQPKEYKQDNTLLRIIDKSLWYFGKYGE